MDISYLNCSDKYIRAVYNKLLLAVKCSISVTYLDDLQVCADISKYNYYFKAPLHRKGKTEK